MKTFAASAVIAVSASAFDVMAVPDFVAGFIYGMTGDNHLTEIEACYQGGEQIVTDSQTAISDFTSGNFFKGIKDAGTVWNEVGGAMTTCKGMDDDISAIESWATIFTEPTKLASTVGKHWLFHGSQIKADFAKEQSDWAAKSYFDAGKDIADALTLAVGPIQTTEEANLDLMPEVEFVGGLLWGLIGDNHLDQVQTCLKDAGTLLTDAENAVSNVAKGSWTSAAGDVKDAVHEVETMFSSGGDCTSFAKDIAAVTAWANVGWFKLAETVAKDMLFHASEIETDAKAISSDWNDKNYYQSGKDLADLLTLSLGPVESSVVAVEEEDNLDLDLLMLPELAAGFVYGMVGDNHLQEMEACYAGVTPLYGFLETALKDLEAFHIIAAIKNIEAFVFHLKVDIAPCEHMSDDVQAIETWAQVFKQPKSLATTVAKHYLLHKRAIKADISAVRADWDNKSYFSVGKDAADLVTVLVGPIE